MWRDLVRGLAAYLTAEILVEGTAKVVILAICLSLLTDSDW